MKTREKMRLYRDIRSYEKYGKNFIYMPRHYTDMVMKSEEKQGLAETYSWNLHPICTFCLKKCIDSGATGNAKRHMLQGYPGN